MIKDAKKTDVIMKGGDYYEMAETNGFETNLENRGYFPCNGNFVMDVLGEERYLKVMRHQAE